MVRVACCVLSSLYRNVRLKLMCHRTSSGDGETIAPIRIDEKRYEVYA